MINTNYNINPQSFTGQKKVSLAQLEKYLSEGLTIKTIAKELGISERTVYNLMNRFDLKYPSKRNCEHINTILTEYSDQNISARKINKQTGLSRYSILKWFKEKYMTNPKMHKLQSIMPLLKSDLSNREIAEETNLNINTILYLRQKYGLGNRNLKKENMMTKILEKFKEGLKQSEIASSLGISRNTVNRYLKNSLGKN